MKLLTLLIWLTLQASVAAQTIALIADARSYESAPIFEQVAAEGPNVVVQLGDLTHDNALTLAEHEQMYRAALTCAAPLGCDFTAWLSPFPLLHVWDDHDYCGNNSDKRCATRQEARQAFKAQFPADYPGVGIWRSVGIGNIRLLLLDERSMANRNKKADGPNKSMLGDEQEAWLLNELAAIQEPWKILVSSRPFNPTCKRLDSWGAFPTAHARLVSEVEAIGADGVLVVSADQHSGGSFDDGTESGLLELSVPHTNTGGDTCVYDPSSRKYCGDWTWRLSGVGFPGYGLLTATPTTLLVEAKGAEGTRFSIELRH